MRPIAEGLGGLPLRADLIAQQKRLRELEDRIRKTQRPVDAPEPPQDNEAEGWLLSYLDLLTLLLVMLVVLLATSKPSDEAVKTSTDTVATTTTEKLVAELPPISLAIVGSTADHRSERTPWQFFESQLGGLVPAPVALPKFDAHPMPTVTAPIPLALEMPYTPVPALAALAPPRPANIAAEPTENLPTPAPEVHGQPDTMADTTTDAEPSKTALLPGLDLSALGEDIDVIVRERSVSFRISNELLFNPGQVDLTPRGIEVLKRVVQVVRDNDLPVTVEGHTDPVPIRNNRFPSNWELSSFRATSVLRMLLDAGLDPQRLRAIGYADTRPIADNANTEGRAQNRRVELMLEVPAETAGER